jgi:hypothetical protein
MLARLNAAKTCVTISRGVGLIASKLAFPGLLALWPRSVVYCIFERAGN